MIPSRSIDHCHLCLIACRISLLGGLIQLRQPPGRRRVSSEAWSCVPLLVLGRDAATSSGPVTWKCLLGSRPLPLPTNHSPIVVRTEVTVANGIIRTRRDANGNPVKYEVRWREPGGGERSDTFPADQKRLADQHLAKVRKRTTDPTRLRPRDRTVDWFVEEIWYPGAFRDKASSTKSSWRSALDNRSDVDRADAAVRPKGCGHRLRHRDGVVCDQVRCDNCADDHASGRKDPCRESTVFSSD